MIPVPVLDRVLTGMRAAEESGVEIESVLVLYINNPGQTVVSYHLVTVEVAEQICHVETAFSLRLGKVLQLVDL